MHYATTANMAPGHYSEGTYKVRFNQYTKSDKWYMNN